MHRRSLFDRLALPLLGCAALGLVAAMGLGAVAFSRPTGPPPGYAQEITLTYGATGDDDVYENGEVRTGDPVFLDVTSRVDVTAAYRLTGEEIERARGELGLNARVRATNGWQRTIELVAPQSFTGPRHEVTARFSLAQVRRMLTAMQRATGTTELSYRVDLLPQVSGSATIGDRQVRLEQAPAITFRMTREQFVLDARADRVAGDPIVVTSESAPAEQPGGVLGMPVTAARWISVLLALASLLLAAFVVLRPRHAVARRPDPLRRLRRPVVPVGADELDRPAVDVADLDALVDLAEMYGSPLLEVRRSGAPTAYLLQHDGGWYRYSPAADEQRAAAAADAQPGPESPRRERVGRAATGESWAPRTGSRRSEAAPVVPVTVGGFGTADHVGTRAGGRTDDDAPAEDTHADGERTGRRAEHADDTDAVFPGTRAGAHAGAAPDERPADDLPVDGAEPAIAETAADAASRTDVAAGTAAVPPQRRRRRARHADPAGPVDAPAVPPVGLTGGVTGDLAGDPTPAASQDLPADLPVDVPRDLPADLPAAAYAGDADEDLPEDAYAAAAAALAGETSAPGLGEPAAESPGEGDRSPTFEEVLASYLAPMDEADVAGEPARPEDADFEDPSEFGEHPESAEYGSAADTDYGDYTDYVGAGGDAPVAAPEDAPWAMSPTGRYASTSAEAPAHAAATATGGVDTAAPVGERRARRARHRGASDMEAPAMTQIPRQERRAHGDDGTA